MVEESWFKECKESGVKVHQHMGEQFVIYKGFKIIKRGEEYSSVDVRKNDFYSPISKEDIGVINRRGFIKGVGILSHRRNKRRVGIYRALISRVRRELKLYHSGLRESSRKEFFKKKIRNAELRIDKSKTLLALYKTRVAQFILNS